MRQTWAALLFLGFFSCSASATADNGVDRGGGDSYEQEFRTLGTDIARKLRALQTEAPGLFTLNIEEFEATVASTHVISTDEPVTVVIDGKAVPREAANSASEKTIWVNRPMWNSRGTDRISKQSIAFHEYLGVMRNDRAYELSVAYRQRLEFEADTTQFKIALADQTKDLGAALSDYFKVRFEPVFARIETIATTAEYQRCIDQKSKAGKPERLADCFGVTAMLISASKLTPAAADDPSARSNPNAGMDTFIFAMLKEQFHCGWPPPRALLNRIFDSTRQWQIVCPRIDAIIAAIEAPKKIEDPALYRQMSQKFLAFIDTIPSQQRKNFAMGVHNRLVDEFNRSAREVGDQLQTLHTSTDKDCPGDLADGIRCAVPRILDYVTKDLAPAMLARQKHLNQSVADSVRAIADYVE